MRVDHICVTLITPFIEVAQENRNLLQQCESPIAGQPRRVCIPREGGADDQAPVVAWQLLDVVGEALEYSVLKQHHLYIRRVKGRHREPILSQVIAYRREGLLPGEITDDRDDQIFAVQAAHEVVV